MPTTESITSLTAPARPRGSDRPAIIGRRRTPRAPFASVVSEVDETLGRQLAELRAVDAASVVDTHLKQLLTQAGKGVSPDAPDAVRFAQLRAFNPKELERFEDFVSWSLSRVQPRMRAIEGGADRSHVPSTEPADLSIVTRPPAKPSGGWTGALQSKVREAWARADEAQREQLNRLWDDATYPGVPENLRETNVGDRVGRLRPSMLRTQLSKYKREHPEGFTAFERAVDEVLAGAGSPTLAEPAPSTAGAKYNAVMDALSRLPAKIRADVVRGLDDIDKASHALQEKHYKQIQALTDHRLKSLRSREPEKVSEIERMIDGVYEALHRFGSALGARAGSYPIAPTSAVDQVERVARWIESDSDVSNAFGWGSGDALRGTLRQKTEMVRALAESLDHAGVEPPASLAGAAPRTPPRSQALDGPVVSIDDAAHDAAFIRDVERARQLAPERLRQELDQKLGDLESDVFGDIATLTAQRVSQMRADRPGTFALIEQRIRALTRGESPDLSSDEKAFIKFVRTLSPARTARARADIASGRPLGAPVPGRLLPFDAKGPDATA